MSSWRDRAKKIDPSTVSEQATGTWRDRARRIDQDQMREFMPPTERSTVGAFADFATNPFGFGDELAGGFEAAGKIVGLENLGQGMSEIRTREPIGLDIDAIREAYREGKEQWQGRLGEARDQQPGAAFAGQMAGDIGASLAGGMLARGAAAGTGALSKVAQGVTSGGVFRQAAKTGAIAGGLSGAGFSEGESALDVGLDTAKGSAIGALTALATTGAMVGGSKVLKAGYDKLKSGTKDLLIGFGKRYTGASEDAIRKYMSDPSKYKDTLSVEQLKEMLDKAYQAKAAGVKDLDDAILALKNSYDDSVMRTAEKLGVEADLVRSNLETAKAAARDVSDDLKFKLRHADPVQPMQAVTQSIEKLREKVIKGSQNAFEVLETAPVKIGSKTFSNVGDKGVFPRRWIEKSLKDGMKSLEVDGKAPFQGTQLQAYNALQKQLETLQQYPDSLSLPAVKKIIQSYDSTGIFKGGGIGSIDEVDQATQKLIRGKIDRFLKKVVPDYGKAMKLVAEDARALSEVQQKFGSPDKVIGALGRLHKATSVGERDVLKKLQERTGDNLDEVLRPYIKTKSVLENPRKLRKLIDLQPESKALKELEGVAKDVPMSFSAQRSQARQMVSPQFEPRLQSLATQRQGLGGELKEFGVTPQNSEATIRSLLRPQAPIEKTKTIEKFVPEIAGEIDRTRVATAFEKGRPQGSRNTLLGGLLGRAAEGLSAVDPTGVLPATLGLAGAAFDQFGGKAVKGAIRASKGIDQKILSAAPKLGKFGRVIEEAGQRGAAAANASHYTLYKNNAEYRKKWNEVQEKEREKRLRGEE